MRLLAKLRLGVVMGVAVLSAGCLFPEVIEVNVSGNQEEGASISISTNAEVSLCVQEEQDNEFTCLYAGEAGAAITSNVVLSGADVLLLVIFDPLILQVPATATNFAGSFLHHATGTSGDLVITSGLTSFQADANTTITAEPGMQFVVLDLPDTAVAGAYAFNVNFTVPPGTMALPLKAMLAGRVVANGQTFFPPLLPCVSDFASVPALNVPFPGGGSVPLPVAQVQGCDGVVYDFGSGGVPSEDADGDGVPDEQDACPGTVIPESIPTERLGVNRFALVDGDTTFDTTAPHGAGPRRAFTIEDTAGCSCEQVVAQLDLGAGHRKFGCSISAIEEWIALVNP